MHQQKRIYRELQYTPAEENLQRTTVYTSRRESTLAGTMLLFWLWNMPCTMMDPMLHNNAQMTDAHILHGKHSSVEAL